MSTVIQQETYWDAIPGIKGLIEAHWREVAHYQDEVKLDPDWSKYAALDSQNRVVVLTARQDGVMVGYSMFFLHHHIHYRDCLVASNDVLYLRPEVRGVVGAKLIMRSESVLRALGVHRITWHIKPEHDWSGMMKRLGYDTEEIIVGKLLGDPHGV